MKTCKVEKCDNKHRRNGYCAKHSEQIKQYGKILERTMYTPNEFIEKEGYIEICLYNIENFFSL